jgi:hypothetical protein
VNLKRGGQLTVKVGNGEEMCGMITELGSVSGCPRPTPYRSSVCGTDRRTDFGRKESTKTHRVGSFSVFVGGRRSFMLMINRNFTRYLNRVLVGESGSLFG